MIEQTPRIIFLFEIILSVLFRGVLLYLMDVLLQRSYLEQPTSIKSRLPLAKGSLDVELLELDASILVRLTPRNPEKYFLVLHNTLPAVSRHA